MTSIEWSALDGVDLYLTFRCNRRCTTCFIGDTQLDAGTAMPLDMVVGIVKWCESVPNVGEVVLLGGEPSLHPDFEGVIRLLADSRLHVRLVTNGSGRARRLPTSLLQTLARVHVSIDGSTPAINDETRGRGAFRDALRMVELVVGAKVPLTINFTASPTHLDDISQMIELAESVGAEILNVHWPSQMGSCAADRTVSSAQKWFAAQAQAAEVVRQSHGQVKVNWQVSFTREPLPGVCALRQGSNLEVMPDGSAYVCGLVVDRPGTSKYAWQGSEFVERQGSFEARMGRLAGPCPARSEPMPAGIFPVCIYHRVLYERESGR